MVSGGNLCLKGQIFLCLSSHLSFFSTALTREVTFNAQDLQDCF